jgi:Domain of unknown function (DUF5680)
MEKYIHFLIQAKKKTYASSQGKVDSSRPNSYDLRYDEDTLTYIDSYLGTHLFSGEEAIWDNGNPVWAMNYSGRVLSEDFSSKFLKASLCNPTASYPYRGQPIFKEGDYTYTMDVHGDFEWFIGRELIFFQEKLVYELNFHGGKVVDKHFD